MFTPKELNAIDPVYFSIIALHGSAVTLQSSNTGHCWHILLEEYPTPATAGISFWRNTHVSEAAGSITPITEEPLTMNTGMELRFPAVSGRSGPMTPIGLAGKGLIGSDPGKTTKQTNRRYAHEQETYQSRIH